MDTSGETFVNTNSMEDLSEGTSPNRIQKEGTFSEVKYNFGIVNDSSQTTQSNTSSDFDKECPVRKRRIRTKARIPDSNFESCKKIDFLQRANSTDEEMKDCSVELVMHKQTSLHMRPEDKELEVRMMLSNNRE